MNLLLLLQIAIDLVLIGGGLLLFARVLRNPKDDPRLSRGLQLLQTKIAILEDLSDRTDHQVQQLTGLLDNKMRELNMKVQLSQRQLDLIDASMQKSLQVAEIFQDKIPHQEIVERQVTKKYIEAARMSHDGKTAREISEQLGLPLGEVELIGKIHANELRFQDDELPAWAKSQQTNQVAKPSISAEPVDEFELPGLNEAPIRAESARSALQGTRVEPSVELEKLGEKFRKALASNIRPVDFPQSPLKSSPF